jgi:hypothetical protein
MEEKEQPISILDIETDKKEDEKGVGESDNSNEPESSSSNEKKTIIVG